MVAWTMLLALTSALVAASSATTPSTTSAYPRLVALPEQLTFEEAETACLKLRGTVAAPTEPNFEEYLEGLPKQQPHWALYKDPLGNHTENEEYVDCYAIDSSQKDSAGHSKVLSKSCSEKLPAVCSVADGMKCSSKKELYSNGYCYKHIDKLYNATEGEKACEKEGSTLASVHSAGENHAIRLLVGDVSSHTGTTARNCVRLGLRLAVSNDTKQHTRGTAYDGSSFDFGFQQCNKEGNYPWCKGNPNCAEPSYYASILMYITQPGHIKPCKTCWVDVRDAGGCDVLCKKKLD